MADSGTGSSIAPDSGSVAQKLAGPIPKRLQDYAPPDYLVDSIDLDFDLHPQRTVVTSRLSVRGNAKAQRWNTAQSTGRLPDLVLDSGDGLKLVAGSLRIGEEVVRDEMFNVGQGCLVVNGEEIRRVLGESRSSAFEIETKAMINPEANTALEGLYMSGGNFCTQCEAEGFRRITFFPDRPDVMSRYTVSLTAPKDLFPVLLSNGNLVETRDLDNGLHYAKYVDPFPKPAYLFALVAGRLIYLEDFFTTMSGRKIILRIYVREGDLEKCPHAMLSLQQAMKWDEEVYGREYDLDIFNIVAVNDFNMGAMENKSLNIFNSRFVLVSQSTATDSDYNAVQGVIAHEYFHNWTGNRVTCRDWFQLSLKEGLTVFRDQEFSGDMLSRSVARITDVMRLRESQFPQDSGPLAHPVRPDSYLEINNFYSTTVYEKGAEVIRMLRNIVGNEGFRKGTDLYFDRHDGSAVTCDDWVAAIQDANPDVNLSQFKLWYSQAGTPRVTVNVTRDQSNATMSLDITQELPDTPGQTHKQPMVIPVSTGLVSKDGTTSEVDLGDGTPKETKTLLLDKRSQRFTLRGVQPDCIPSLLRDFSAPVNLTVKYDGEDEKMYHLALAMGSDRDNFNRWEASQKIATIALIEKYNCLKESVSYELSPEVTSAFRKVLLDPSVDKLFKAQVLRFPSEKLLTEKVSVADPDLIHGASEWFQKTIASALFPELSNILREFADDADFSLDIESQGKRALGLIAMKLLASTGEKVAIQRCLNSVRSGTTMTVVISALEILANSDSPKRMEELREFYMRWRSDPLVVGKWLRLRATVPRASTLDDCVSLLSHESFDISNPNKVYSLIGGFTQGNQFGFHSRKAKSYEFLADQVIALDSLNPQVAARMVSGFTSWRKFDLERQGLMKLQLERIRNVSNVSANVYEVVSKSLQEN